jgi:hypothetical protein
MMANLTGNINLISSGVQYALFIIFSTIMFFFIDKIGRRPLLIYGALAMGFCHFVVGGVLSAGEYVPGGIGDNPNVVIRVTGAKSHVVIAFCYLLIIVYAMTLAPVAWVYAAEVWSLETRAVGMSISAIGNWLFNFALGLYIPPGFQNITVSSKRCRCRPVFVLTLPLVANVHHLRCHVRSRCHSILLHLPRDWRKDARGDRGAVRSQRTQAMAHQAWWVETRQDRRGGQGKQDHDRAHQPRLGEGLRLYGPWRTIRILFSVNTSLMRVSLLLRLVIILVPFASLAKETRALTSIPELPTLCLPHRLS